MADDLGAIGSFFFYVFIVHPATAWILRPGRFERSKSIMYAIAFLAALAAVKTGIEMNEKGPNHYSLLNVDRASSPLDIKRAYKKLSLVLHPDKNDAPDAEEQFDNLKKSYDVLIDMEYREVYNKFGAAGIESNKRFDESTFFMELGVFYVTWGIMVYMLTLGKKSGEARQWTFTGLILMLVIEIAIMTSTENPLPEWLFPTTTEYEMIWLLHTLFPAFMNGCRSMGSYLYVDLDEKQRALLKALQEQNQDILLVLRDVQIGIQNLQTSGVSSGPRLGNSTLTPSTAGLSAASDVTARATPTGKIKELQNRLQPNKPNIAPTANQAQAKNTGSSSFGFYGMIIAYVAISYMFG